MRIQYNQGLFTQNRYNHTNTELNKTLNKLSSGYKINQAADDAAGLGISENMRAQIRGLNQAGENIQDGQNLINVMDSALGTMQSPMLNRMRELIIQAANDTNTDSDRLLIQKEIDELIDGVDNIVHNTEYNTIKTFIPPSQLVPGTTSTGKSDIVFIVDNTSSMGAEINNLKNNISNFVSALKAHNIDTQLGLIYYEDESKNLGNLGGDNVPAKNLGFPLDVDSFKSIINSTPLGGGADVPESGLEAIHLANSIPNFRPDATKNYILITDALVHEAKRTGFTDVNNNGVQESGEPDIFDTTRSTHTIQSIIDSLGETTVTVIGPEDTSVKNQLSQLSTSTDGSYLNVKGSYSEQLLALAEKITNEAGGVFTEESMEPVIIQAGANEGQHITIPLYDMRDFRLMLADMALTPYSAAMDALSRVDNIIAKISSRRAEYGALSNRLEHAYNNVKNTEENLTKAESQLRDADMAKAMSKLKKDQVLLQSSQSMMAQINQMSQGVLEILG